MQTARDTPPEQSPVSVPLIEAPDGTAPDKEDRVCQSVSATSANVAPQPPASLGHVPSLDGLRAVSFLFVFASHTGLGRFPGGFGVTIFFFLSGYLITSLLRTEYERTGTINLRHFWMRRALRILPPFYLVLIAAITGTLIFDPPGTLSGSGVTAQLLHVSNYWIAAHGYGGLPNGTGVYWSLAVEEHFYLLFPWLYILMQKLGLSRRNQAFLLWGLCAAVLLWRCVLVFRWDPPSDRTYLASDTRIDSILFGCALAVWRNPVLDAPELNEHRWHVVWVPVALAVFLGCLLYRAPAFRETVRYSLQGIALIALFTAAIRFPRWFAFRLLNNRVADFLGSLSYSLYLLHFVVIGATVAVLPYLPPWVTAILALGLSVTLAQIIRIAVEEPCARIRRRLSL
jgi:peptidoglycan/LPS O-acetylase OafA/YrhL